MSKLVPLQAQPGASERASPVASGSMLPAIVTEAGPHAAERFIEFFTANLRNAHTRRANARAALSFLAYCEGRGGMSLLQIRPVLVAAYTEGHQGQLQSVKTAGRSSRRK